MRKLTAIRKRLLGYPKRYTLAFLGGFLTLIVPFFSMQLLSETNVPTSELAFAEYSDVLGKGAGSIMPASCESAFEHVAGECATINAVCGAARYTCSAGFLFSYGETAVAYEWWCSGSNGGTNANCTEPKFFAVNVRFSQSNPYLGAVSISNDYYDLGGTSAMISWSAPGATSCTATGPAGWSGTPISTAAGNLPNGSKRVIYSGISPTKRTYTINCTDGVTSKSAATTIFWEGSGSLR